MTKLTQAKIVIGVLAVQNLATVIVLTKALSDVLKTQRIFRGYSETLTESVDKHVPNEYRVKIMEDLHIWRIAENYGELVLPPIDQE